MQAEYHAWRGCGYAKVLAKLVPPSATRLRRDFGAILNLIRAHALLHQVTRKKDDKGRIIATYDDYAAVRDTVAEVIAQAVEATVPTTVRETVNAVQHLITGGKSHVSLAELAEDLELDRGTVSRRVREAKSRGYLKNLEERKGMVAKVVVGAAMPEDQPILPSVEDLVLQCCSGDGGDKHPPCREPWDAETTSDDGDLETPLAIMEIDGELDTLSIPDFLRRP